MSEKKKPSKEGDYKPSRLRSWFRQKIKATPQEGTSHSLNVASNAKTLPTKSVPEVEQLTSTVPSQSLTPSTATKPASSISDEPIESPNKTAVAPDLWSRAFQELDEKSRKWIPKSSDQETECGKKWASDLIALVRQREEEYKDKTPKLKVGDREIIWRDYANKTVTWLATIGDIAVNFAPTPSPVIWSALKVFMKTNVSQCEDLVAIFGCAEKVLSLMRRGAVYEIVYLRDAPSNNATEDLQDTLVNLYKEILQLLTHALERLNEGQGRQFLRALISPGEGTELVSALSIYEHKLSMTVQACGAVQLQEHQKLLQSLRAPLRRVDENIKMLVEHLQEKSLDEALDYISAISIGNHHLEKRETRAPETCEWLLNHPRFLEWEESSCSSILWLQGSIGTGKSYLTSKVIDRYRFDNKEKIEHGEGFAYFYCNRSDPVRRNSKSIYQSYIRQLARINLYPAGIHKSIFALYRTAKEEQRGLSNGECKAALSELITSYPRTTLILDALDECEPEIRHELILDLRGLVRDANRQVKVYIASRREPDIERSLGSENLVEIGTADNKNDIEKYIEQEMRRLGGSWESVSQGVRDEVKRSITDQSDGMFRWAYLQWEQLKKFKTDQSIVGRLGKMPKSLEQAYDEIYFQNDGFELVILQRAVKLVLCAAEPLKNEELLCAIRLEVQKDSEAETALVSSGPITQYTLESICSNLIVRDSQLEVWKFPHASAAEYFEGRHKDWAGNAHEDVATLLISSLIDCFSTWKIPKVKPSYMQLLWATPLEEDDYLNPRHPFQDYANKYWAWHARKSSNSSQVTWVLKRFLGAEGPQKPSSQQYQSWCRHVMNYYSFSPTAEIHFRDLFPEEKSIFGICSLGIHTLLEGWWDKDIDVLLVNDGDLDLLSIAAKYGHRELCSKLIDHENDVNRAFRSNMRSALVQSLFARQFETTALLLDKGCSTTIYRHGISLLCLAVVHVNWPVEMLLKAGADPNIQCHKCKWGCALETAANWGKVDIAKMLINHGADVNFATEIGEYGSPLAAAAAGRSDECVQLLIEHGANVNAQLQYGNYDSALTAAIDGGLQDCVEILLEHGADVNLADERGVYGSPLAAAAYKGWLGCVKLLIEHGADVNAHLKHKDYKSPLAAAARGRSPDCVKFLVEKGAIVNTGTQLEHGDFHSVLTAAVVGVRNDAEILKYLIEEAGADATILSSTSYWESIPVEFDQSVMIGRYRRVKYLVGRGYVQEELLDDLGLRKKKSNSKAVATLSPEASN
ncbi:hypothetical protein V8C35DRAFT_308211 [Trichoderma chlorosporum]